MVNWQEGDVLTNGIRLHYYRSGGDKPPLVLAHGITDSGMCWPLLSEELAPDYDLIAIDARGHGKSEKPEEGYGRETHAADLAGLIEALGLAKPAVLGHSMGAGSATVLAARYPQAVGCLLLEDPPIRDLGKSVADPTAAAEWSERIQQRREKSVDELIAEGRAENPKWPVAVFAPWAAAKRQVSPNVVKYITAEDATWTEYVQSVQCPVLMITGDPELGGIVTAEMAAAIVELNPRFKPAHIAGAGHNIRRERFAAYVEAVREFLAGVYPEA